MAGHEEDGLTVLLNTTPANAAQTTFAPPVPLALPGFLIDLKSGDFNQDGRPDLAVATFPSDILVFLNTGSGFRTPATLTGFDNREVEVVDVNQDGRPDLVSADGNHHSFSVFLSSTGAGASTATFLAPQTFLETKLEPAFAAPRPEGVIAADFNHDGLPDLSLLDRLPYQRPLLNKTVVGSNTVSFQEMPTIPLAGSFGESQAVADLNGDGRVDLVGGHTDFGLSGLGVTLNQTAANATALFFEAVTQFDTQGVEPGGVEIADMNGDGKNDLVVANLDSNSVTVLVNTGVLGAPSVAFDPAQSTVIPVGSFPVSLVAEDFDKDGRVDAVTPNEGDNTITVLHNTTPQGATKTTFTTATYAVGNLPEDVFFEDFDGDGLVDLVVPNQDDNTVSVLRNTSSGGALTFAPAVAFNVGQKPNTVDTGDMNGDGKFDILTTNRDSDDVSVLVNQSSPGTLAFGAALSFPTGHEPSSIYVQDFNDDGIADVGSVSPTDESVDVLVNNNAPNHGVSFSRVTVGGFTEATAWNTRDLSGDRRRDLAVSRGDGSLQIAINTAQAQLGFTLRSVYTTGRVAETAWSVEIGDVNGDGVNDVVTTNLFENSVSVLLGL